MDLDPGKVLTEAREAAKEKRYSTALEKYQWFFENSIEIKRSYYGVRLSYCLDEWAELGKEYPPAMKALIELKDRSLSDFKSTLSRQSFHEYSSIAGYLDLQDEVLEQFMSLHKSNKQLAGNFFTFVYEHCAKKEMWGICREHLGNGQAQYEKALEMFDHMVGFSKTKADVGGESIYQEALEAIGRETLWILNMLHHEHATEEYELIMTRMQQDLTERGFESTYTKIYESSPSAEHR